jgi:FMN phosphatase YigB (HAD superfamily)
MNRVKFFYFDLGMVLLRFDVEVMCRRMAEVAGLDPPQVRRALFEHPLQKDYERGLSTTREFYETFCDTTGTRPNFEALLCAASDIFDLDAAMIPVVAHLYEAGHRLGILSNTCDCHWEHCLRRFPLLNELFEVHALSYRIGAAKPEVAMFEAAAMLAGVELAEVFFTDDIPGHVAGARAAGFDAVQFTSPRQLVAELRSRSVRWNY